MRRIALALAALPLAISGSLQADLSSAALAKEDDWQSAQVPGAWEEKGPAAARAHDGFAWYRTWVKVPDSFFSKHERNLFEESVSVYVRELADAHEIFVNGRSIGGAGKFPPDFASGRGALHRHKVPVGTLRKGQWNEIAVRVYNRSGPGGFLGEAPFIMDYFLECVLEGAWQMRLGDDASWAGPALAERPKASSFDRFRESNRVLGETAERVTGPKLPPAESHSKMTSAADLVVELMLHEPEVAQPTHLSFDERGRLWIAQYRQYPYPAGLRMVSRDKYYRSHYDKVPPAPPNHDRGRDVVSVHADTDGDGRYDRHTVFQDGLNMANAALRGRGGVWIMHTPYLVFYPDRDFDDKPDGPPVVHLAGFGLEDTHSTANGLVWGMDGWIYGAQGSTTTSRIRRPGLDRPDSEGIYYEGCMVWRYHPETRVYEIFAEGTGNIFGLEVDAQGRLFSGHNGGQTRGWHYVQGGLYLKQGVDPGKFGPPRNPYAFGELPMMRAEATVQRFSHFAAMAEGTALPVSYAGMFFSLDPLHSVVIASRRKVRGATFETVDVGPVLSSADAGFRPVHIANAPDGSLLVADFYDHYIAHGQHYQSQIDPTTGRVYRLRGKVSPLERDTDLSKKNVDELVALLSHPNKWHRHTAVRLLGERKDPAATPKLKALLSSDRGLGALCALWALYQSAGLDDASALAGLRHAYAPVRAWTVRLLGDARRVPPAAVEQARVEPDPEVRAQMAATARRLPVAQAMLLVAALLARDEDAGDPYVPMLCWWAIESHATADRNAALVFLDDRALWDRPMVFDHVLPRVMRRFALEGRRADLLTCSELLKKAPSPRHAAQLIKGFEEAYRGRAMTGLPEELVEALDAAGPPSPMLRLRRGETAAVEQAFKTVQDPKAKLEERLLFARTLGEVRQSGAVPVLLATAAGDAPEPLRKAALAALTAYEDEAIGAQVAALLPKLLRDTRTAALAVLASRPGWSRSLLDAVQSGALPAASVPPDVAERVRDYKDERVERLLPKPAPSENARKRIAEIAAVLEGGTGDPYAGEPLYMQRCAPCHKLFFKGGNVGPDLTPYQRDNLGTMLPSIVEPNAEVREGYQSFKVETTDGRRLRGFVVERDAQLTVLRGMEGEDLRLRQAEIKSIEPTGLSPMPEGLLEGLSAKELRDLFAYLRISQPITK